MKNLIKM
jgi:UDP-N-acetylglucosamine--dolichyl-phosphate N-acetylglucosaminephosphotransferase